MFQFWLKLDNHNGYFTLHYFTLLYFTFTTCVLACGSDWVGNPLWWCHHPARQVSDTPSTCRSLTPEISDVTGAIHKGRSSDSGKCARFVMLCVHFLTCYVSLFSNWLTRLAVDSQVTQEEAYPPKLQTTLQTIFSKIRTRRRGGGSDCMPSWYLASDCYRGHQAHGGSCCGWHLLLTCSRWEFCCLWYNIHLYHVRSIGKWYSTQ